MILECNHLTSDKTIKEVICEMFIKLICIYKNAPLNNLDHQFMSTCQGRSFKTYPSG